MKESYREELASRSGLEPYAGGGDVAGVALVRGNAGQPLSSDINTFACRSCGDREKATSSRPLFGQAPTDAAESKNLCMRRHPKRENRLTRSLALKTAYNETYEYDFLDRLRDANRPGDSGIGSLDQSWTLRPTGNWASFISDGVEQTRTHNNANEILTITADPNDPPLLPVTRSPSRQRIWPAWRSSACSAAASRRRRRPVGSSRARRTCCAR